MRSWRNFGIKILLKRFHVRAATAALIFLLAFTFPGLALAKTPQIDPLLQLKLTELANAQRQRKKLPALKINPALTLAAQMKAESMAKNGYFSHTSPEGSTPWFWFRLAGYRYEYAGENLALNYIDPKDIKNAWVSSPSHRANILNSHFTEVGTGYAWGNYKGKKMLFVAQLYGRPQAKFSL